MSSPTPRRTAQPTPEKDEPDGKGPNLFVLYGCLLLALVGAMACAAAVVWPFYKHR